MEEQVDRPPVICGARYGDCICIVPIAEKHDVHICDPINCGGQWEGEEGWEIPRVMPFIRFTVPVKYVEAMRETVKRNKNVF